MSAQQRSYDEEVALWEEQSKIVDDLSSMWSQVPEFPERSEEELQEHYKNLERNLADDESAGIGEAFSYRPSTDQPMFRFSSYRSGEPMDYEYIVEGMLRFGHNAWSGPRGVGKTSTLIPLLCAIAGLIPHYPLQIKLRRRVILVTEDEQHTAPRMTKLRPRLTHLPNKLSVLLRRPRTHLYLQAFRLTGQ